MLFHLTAEAHWESIERDGEILSFSEKRRRGIEGT